MGKKNKCKKEDKGKLSENGLFFTERNNNGEQKAVKLCRLILDDIFDKVLTFDSDRFGNTVKLKKGVLKDYFNYYEDNQAIQIYESLYVYGGLKALNHMYEKVMEHESDSKDYIKKRKDDPLFTCVWDLIHEVAGVIYCWMDDELPNMWEGYNKIMYKVVEHQAKTYTKLREHYKKSEWTEIVDIICWFDSVLKTIKPKD